MWPPADSPTPGYGIVELSWEVIPAPGQSPIILNGTVEQVHSQLLEINPKYQAEVFEKREDLLAAPTAAPAATAATDLTEPTAVAHSAQIWRIQCGGYDSASTKRIKDGIKYLNGIAGQPKNGPGPNNCGRVSCSYNSSIWWCNDVSILFPCNNSVSKVQVADFGFRTLPPKHSLDSIPLQQVPRRLSTLVPGKIIRLFLVQENTRVIGGLSSREIYARLEILVSFLSVCAGVVNDRDV
jgi:hypothetical protein